MIVAPHSIPAGTEPLRHLSSRRQGFSLAECMLSVAITATSLLAVIGMLMGTLGVARDAKEETVSGVLIRQLAGEIRDMPQVAVPPAQAKPVIVLVDEAMKILEHSSYKDSKVMQAYESGASSAVAASFARIDRVPDPQNPLMDHIVIRVESPASAPPAGRTVRRYAALSPK